MKCCSGSSTIAAIAAVLGLVGVGVGAYNFATTGCPLGSCSSEKVTLTSKTDKKSDGCCGSQEAAPAQLAAHVEPGSASHCTEGKAAGQCPMSAGSCGEGAAPAVKTEGDCSAKAAAHCTEKTACMEKSASECTDKSACCDASKPCEDKSACCKGEKAEKKAAEEPKGQN